jgi:RNA polymerase sigma factor (sigma-70 family)
MEINVPDCLRRWRAGDESAAAQIIDHLYPVISRIVRTHLPRRDPEEDLVQEILLKVFSRLHQYKADAPLSHWVSRLAVTTCLDRLRAQKIRPEIRWSDLTPEEGDLFERATLSSHTRDARDSIYARDLVEKLLSSLSADERSLILLADLDGFSLEEIAQRTGWGLSKIKMRLFRIRGQLRKMMIRLKEQT